MSGHIPNNKLKNKGTYKDTINIALAGNPNVGKSVIFNQLTGLSQTIGNWPGKTVERMEGYLDFLGYRFNIVDLPGIYSLSTYSLEEIVSREYIVSDDVDVIINVVDATNLERNLFFTFQLLELKVPLIIAINQMDILRRRNIEIDFKALENIFKLPVLPVVAVHGTGVHQLLEEAIEMVVFQYPHTHYNEKTRDEHDHHSHNYYRTEHIHDKVKVNSKVKNNFEFPELSKLLSFGKEVESCIGELIMEINNSQLSSALIKYPPRFLAIKLLENDEEIKSSFKNNEIIKIADEFRNQLEDIHGEDVHTIISSEIYNKIHDINDKVLIIKPHKGKRKVRLADVFDHLTTHSILGYLILVAVLFGIYIFTFSFGDFFSGLIDELYTTWSEFIYNSFGEENLIVKIFWDGGVGGFLGGIGGVLVYVIPFFLVIEILQDSGYLPRAAFLMDKAMHTIGVHGKTIIPMILGFGCNIPACAGCRIMETEREKKLSVVLSSLVPCAAVMTVVLGLVGRYIGFFWVTILFLINFGVIFLIGRILNKVMPGQCTELIMEMHEYRMPNSKVILKQTWIRTKEFVYKALPIIIVLGILLEILLIFNALEPINVILSPITVFWLGLPSITGVFLIYGILRKELTLVLLAVLANSIGVSLVELLSPFQMINFCLVTMLYIPCFATIIIIAKQTNWKYAIQISLLEIGVALLIGGALNFGFIIFSSF
ncbi:MAG: ferrous iron transport protein B [Promethearchaeota archaeon Loki_b31]|nr:MAG: ferrous iron transport protein B [Candidatus Lokiarchaeota archaeon Loki_b31]